MSWEPIDCARSDQIGRARLSVSSSLTNFVGGEVLDDRFPHHTVTVWCDAEGVDVLKDLLDEDGCRHWVAVAHLLDEGA